MIRHISFVVAVVLAFTACSQVSDRSSAEYPEWEYTRIKKELLKCWNTWDTRSVFTEVWSEDKLGVKVSLIDSDGAENGSLRIGNRDKFYHWGALLGYITLLENNHK